MLISLVCQWQLFSGHNKGLNIDIKKKAKPERCKYNQISRTIQSIPVQSLHLVIRSIGRPTAARFHLSTNKHLVFTLKDRLYKPHTYQSISARRHSKANASREYLRTESNKYPRAITNVYTTKMTKYWPLI